MVRTKADCPAAGRKVVAARAPRKNVGASSSSAGSSTSNGSSPAGKYAGGNPVCPRPTPDWQKGINSFFTQKPSNKENCKPEEKAAASSQSTDCQPSGSCSSSSSTSHSEESPSSASRSASS